MAVHLKIEAEKYKALAFTIKKEGEKLLPGRSTRRAEKEESTRSYVCALYVKKKKGQCPYLKESIKHRQLKVNQLRKMNLQ